MASSSKKHTPVHYLFTIFYTFVLSVVNSLIWITLGSVGYLVYQSMKSPYHLIIGLPLLIIGLGMTINNLGSFLLSFFSPSFNRGMCKICNKE